MENLERSEWQYLLESINDFKNPPSSNGEATLNISEYHLIPPCLQLPHYIGKLFLSKYFTSGMKEEDGQDNYRNRISLGSESKSKNSMMS